MAPRNSADDYLGALKALLPPGRVWEPAFGSVREKVLTAIALGLARVDAAAVALIVDSFPATCEQLLPEWEASTGLPDPCAGLAATVQQRQSQVVARLANTGGQSAAYFASYAAQLGYRITITEFASFRAGQSRVGTALGGDSWASVWAVNAPLGGVTAFRAGRSAAGEPLVAFGNAVLECELRAAAPAHTLLTFRYS